MPYFTPLFVATPNGLVATWIPTATLAADVRAWDALIDSSPPGTAVPALANPIPNGQITTSVFRLLNEAGMAFTKGVGLPQLSASSLASVYRYADLFLGTDPNLRLIQGVENADPRLKGLLTEEMALGATCVVLKDYMDVPLLSDCKPLMQASALNPRHVAYRINPPNLERPDFFGVTSGGEAVFIESKGRLGPRSVIAQDIVKGKGQVENVVPLIYQLRQNWGRVVIGTNIRIQAPVIRSDTTTHIIDPTGPRGGNESIVDDYPIRIAYSKIMKFAGQFVLAELLLLRQTLPIPPAIPALRWEGRLLIPLGNSPVGGLVTLDSRVFRVLRDHPRGGLLAELLPLIGLMVPVLPENNGINGPIIHRNGVVVLLGTETVEETLLDSETMLPFRGM